MPVLCDRLGFTAQIRTQLTFLHVLGPCSPLRVVVFCLFRCGCFAVLSSAVGRFVGWACCCLCCRPGWGVVFCLSFFFSSSLLPRCWTWHVSNTDVSFRCALGSSVKRTQTLFRVLFGLAVTTVETQKQTLTNTTVLKCVLKNQRFVLEVSSKIKTSLRN